MPKSAFPPHLQDIENNFPDDEQFGTTTWFGKLYRYVNKATKTWFAFSYRCPEWWAMTEKYPRTLFAIGGEGKWRFESDYSEIYSPYLLKTGELVYLSRQQLYKRWNFAIQMCRFKILPLWIPMISFHFYFKVKDVPKIGNDTSNLDGKLLFFYWNHYDADMVYWMFTSAYIGLNWK